MRSVIHKAAGGAPDSAVIDARAGEGAIVERKQVARGAPPVSGRADRGRDKAIIKRGAPLSVGLPFSNPVYAVYVVRLYDCNACQFPG